MKEIRTGEHQAEGWVIPIRKLGNIAQRLSQADPDHSVFFASQIGLRTRLGRRRLVWIGRDQDTLAAGVVFPRMIGTHQAVAAQSPQRKLCAAVNTEIAPAVNSRHASATVPRRNPRACAPEACQPQLLATRQGQTTPQRVWGPPGLLPFIDLLRFILVARGQK